VGPREWRPTQWACLLGRAVGRRVAEAEVVANSSTIGARRRELRPAGMVCPGNRDSVCG
jgi:hypothetical protein